MDSANPLSIFETHLPALGLTDHALEPLTGDASDRSYARLRKESGTLIVAHWPQGQDPEHFARISDHLRKIGLSAPKIHSIDKINKIVILEDFGFHNIYNALENKLDENIAYNYCVSTLAHLHRHAHIDDLPLWESTQMAERAAATFIDWWWPAVFGSKATSHERSRFVDAIKLMISPFDGHRCFVHRDYFPGNLMYLDRAAPRNVGILDFQDASIGHPAYDLVSLVEDARRDVSPALREDMVALYLALRPELDPAEFRAAMAACAAQRHLRVAALWVRLERRDGKPHYLPHGPRCWALLDAALAHDATAPLRGFLDTHVPRALRGNPPALRTDAA